MFHLALQDLPFRLVQMLYLSALSIWVGGGFVLGAVAAPLLFQKIGSRTQAGLLFGAILDRFDALTFFLIPLLLLTSAIRFLAGWEVWEGAVPAKYGVLLLFFLLYFYTIASVRPRLKRLRSDIQDFDSLPENNPQRLTFQKLHKQSVRMALLQFLLGLLLLYLN